MKKYNKHVVSGMRPTGDLHLGHYFGALKNWLKLQKQEDIKCFFFSADWHALTTNYHTSQEIKKIRKNMFLDWLSIGIDPKKSTLFSQSYIFEHAELHILLSMITPIPWLERVPSYKDLQNEIKSRDLSTIGFLSYPLLQTADIAMYKGTHVPVGEDQLAHVELSREIIRRFNSYYGETFPEPESMITDTKRLPGLDGRKMSNSYNNVIYLNTSKETTQKTIMLAPTDSQRIRRTDPGNPDVCNIFTYHKLFQNLDALNEIDKSCRNASMGCVDCKKNLLVNINEFQEPIIEKRHEIIKNNDLDDIIEEGNKKAGIYARDTMNQVRNAIGL